MSEQSAVSDRVQVMLRPLGSGLPLGFFAFGNGMALLGGLGLHLLPAATTPDVGWMLITFVTPIELLAAVIAFLARDGLGATGLGLFGASWVTLGVQMLHGTPGATSPVLGLYLVSFSVAVALLAGAASLGQPLLSTILGIASVRGFVDAGYQLSGNTTTQLVAGALALLLTALAFYGGLAFVLEDTMHRTVLPLGRRGQSATALGGGFDEQLAQLESEAGVRRSL